MREYSWLEEIAVVVARGAPGDQLRSLLLTERDIVKRALTLTSRDKGSDFGPLVKRLIYLQSGRSLNEPFNKLFVDRPLYEEPGACAAVLPAIAEYCVYRSVYKLKANTR